MYSHISEAIRQPALIQLSRNIFALRFEVMKVTSAIAAIENLMDRGEITKQTTLVDSSSGVYAHALALACHKLGLRCHIIASKTIDPTLKLQLELLGATVEKAEPLGNLRMDQEWRVAKVQKLLDESKDCYWMRQYHDDIHYLGYEPIAAKIRAEIKGDVLTLIGGVGSGASTGGLARYLSQMYPAIRVVGIQPFESVTFGSAHISDPDAMIAGIGSGIHFENVHHEVYDEIHWLSFEAGLAGSISLIKRQGIFAGLSSGCCWAVSRWEESRLPEQPILLIVADTGHRYAERVFGRYAEAKELEAFSPLEVKTPREIQPPWSWMNWAKRKWDADLEQA